MFIWLTQCACNVCFEVLSFVCDWVTFAVLCVLDKKSDLRKTEKEWIAAESDTETSDAPLGRGKRPKLPKQPGNSDMNKPAGRGGGGAPLTKKVHVAIINWLFIIIQACSSDHWVGCGSGPSMGYVGLGCMFGLGHSVWFIL